MIKTYSPEVRVQISIDLVSSTDGAFVQKQYPGVIVSISDNGSSILIYGTVDAVNAVLKTKIYFYINPDFIVGNDVNVTLVVSDGLNEDLIIKEPLKVAMISYIHMKSQII